MQEATHKNRLLQLQRFYNAAKKRAWDIKDLPWDDLDLVPHTHSEKWRLMWSSVVQQQLQADLFAVKAATYLLTEVEHEEAKMYYTTMVSDEARHVEAWMRMANGLDSVEGFSPYFKELEEMFWEGDSLEEQVLVFQVCYEGCAIDAFRELAKSTQNTILGVVSEKLIGDDIIHHQSGIVFSKHLLSDASPAFKKHLEQKIKKYIPVYIENLTWRPLVRKWFSRFMATRDKAIIKRNKLQLNQAVGELGLVVPFNP